MNEYIAKYLKNKINETGITYRNVSKKTGIEYQRLMRIFNQNAVISASELIALCNVCLLYTSHRICNLLL